MGSVINCKINTTKVPRESYFKGEKGVYLDFTISERREVSQFGQTHTIYIVDKNSKEKIYIGDATLKVFESQPVTQADLPPGMDDIEDAKIEGEQNYDDLPF